MKILLFGASFGSNLDTFINNEIKYLSQRHEVKCVCNRYIEQFPISDIQEIDIDRSSLLQKFYAKGYQYDLFLTFKDKDFAKRLNAIIDDFQPDVIHCHFAYEALMLLDNIRQIKVPILLHFHGYDASKCLTKKSYIAKIKKYLAKPSIYPIYVSDFMRSNLERVNISVEKGMKLYYGINLKEFVPLDDRETKKPFTFLQVSTLVEKKGITYTLNAFSAFLADKIKEDYQLILTGDNERELEELKQEVSDLNIGESVTFFGRANHDQVIQLMKEADVFVHHSITASNGDEEGIPNAIMEAMAMKLPVISTYHAGIPELVEHGVNGFLVKEKDTEDYAKRMNEIITWTLKGENREVIEDRFNYQKHNAQLEKFYLKLLNK